MKLIAALLIFYPLIVPVWKSGPVTYKNSARKKSLTFIATPDLKWQLKSFQQLKDPEIKSRVLFDLGQANNPYAVTMLADLLDEESNEDLQADILINMFAMRRVTQNVESAKFAKFMSSDNDAIRAYSSALYLNYGGDTGTVLKMLEDESSVFVINLLCSQLQTDPDSCSESLLKGLLNSNQPRIRAAGASLLAAMKKDPDSIPELVAICKDSAVSVRSALAEALSKRKSGGIKLLTTLSEDDSAVVRAYVASSKPCRDLLSVFLNLASDSDSEVRRSAAVSIGSIKDSRSVAVASKLLSDPAFEVRDCAERALIQLNPDRDALKKIGEDAMDLPISRPYAITVIGALKDSRFAEKITDYLKNSSDDNIIIRAIQALDSMNFKKSERAVRAKSSSKNPQVQKAVAHALGTFAVKDSFDTLIEQSIIKMDKKHIVVKGNNDVAIEAVTSMGRIADPYFSNRLTEILYNVNLHPGMRSAACWSIARIGSPDVKTVRQLKKIILKETIPVEGGKAFDADSVRISALLALIDTAGSDKNLQDSLPDIISELNPASSVNVFAEPISSPLLKEYVRQASLYMKGVKDIKPSPLPTVPVMMTVRSYRKSK